MPPPRRRPTSAQMTPPPADDPRYTLTYRALRIRYVPVVAAVLAHEQCASIYHNADQWAAA